MLVWRDEAWKYVQNAFVRTQVCLDRACASVIRAQVVSVSAPMYTLFIYATCAPRAVAIKILNVTRSMNMSMNMSKNMKKI